MRSENGMLCLVFALTACGGTSGGGSTVVANTPVHGVYEAIDVAVPNAATGDAVFALSENSGSNVTGEVWFVSPKLHTTAAIYSGTVTHGAQTTVSGTALDRYQNRTVHFQGTIDSSGFTYTIQADTTYSGRAALVAAYVDPGTTYASGGTLLGKRTYAAAQCGNETIALTIAGAHDDAAGLWAVDGTVTVAGQTSTATMRWDGHAVFTADGSISSNLLTLSDFPAPGPIGTWYVNTPCLSTVTT